VARATGSRISGLLPHEGGKEPPAVLRRCEGLKSCRSSRRQGIAALQIREKAILHRGGTQSLASAPILSHVLRLTAIVAASLIARSSYTGRDGRDAVSEHQAEIPSEMSHAYRRSGPTPEESSARRRFPASLRGIAAAASS